MSGRLPSQAFSSKKNTMDLEKLKDFFQKDRFAATSGVKILEVGEGYCKAMLEIEDRHLNAANVVQGGAIFYPGRLCLRVCSQ